MRPVWKGSIGFGLVNIAVKMYTATEENTMAFVQLDKSNHTRIRYKKVNEATGKELQEGDIVKGYNWGGGYVILDEQDFQKTTPEKQDHLEIVQFISEKEIDAVYFEKPAFRNVRISVPSYTVKGWPSFVTTACLMSHSSRPPGE